MPFLEAGLMSLSTYVSLWNYTCIPMCRCLHESRWISSISPYVEMFSPHVCCLQRFICVSSCMFVCVDMAVCTLLWFTYSSVHMHTHGDTFKCLEGVLDSARVCMHFYDYVHRSPDMHASVYICVPLCSGVCLWASMSICTSM